MDQDIEKKDYIPPFIEVTIVEMEQGIAAGSATVVTTNNNEIKDEWETDPVRDDSMDW